MDKRTVRAVVAAVLVAAILIGAAWWSLSDPQVRKTLRDGLKQPPVPTVTK